MNNKMELSKKALTAIDNKNTRLILSIAMNVTEQSIIRWIAGNNDNLTKQAAIKVILEETGLSESEIFETAKA